MSSQKRRCDSPPSNPNYFLQFPNETITIWTSASDNVDFQGVADLQDMIGEDKVYIDMPSEQKLQISQLRNRSALQKEVSGTLPNVILQSPTKTVIVAIMMAFIASLL